MRVEMRWSLDEPMTQAILYIPSTIKLAELDDLEEAITLQLLAVRRSLQKERLVDIPHVKATPEEAAAIRESAKETANGSPARCSICGGTDVSPLSFDVWECAKCGDYVPDRATSSECAARDCTHVWANASNFESGPNERCLNCGAIRVIASVPASAADKCPHGYPIVEGYWCIKCINEKTKIQPAQLDESESDGR